MRRLLLIPAMLLVAVLPFPQNAANASCVGPSLAPTQLTAGAHGTVVGRYWVDGCQDTGSCTETFGCQRCDYGPEPKPLQDIALRLVQGDRSWGLGSTDADKDGDARWKFTVPRDARPGPATLETDIGEPLSVRIR